MQETLLRQNKVKLHFLIKKKVDFGSAIYVIGNIVALGQWSIPNALRLNWNAQDYWSGFVQLIITRPIKIQFKYIMADFQMPNPDRVWWEEGDFNRHLLINGDQQNLVLDNVWSANKICLNLLVPKFVIKNNTEIYLAGGCNQLGNWRNRLKMDKISIQNLSQMQIFKARENIIVEDYYVYSVLLSVQRNLRNFNYYFIKKTQSQWSPDRVPQRQFKIQLGESHQPTCLYIFCKGGNYELLQLSKFTQLYYSKITDQIFIGGSIQTCDDVKQLNKKGIGAILYLASSDHFSKSGPKNLVKMISQQHKIEYLSMKIDLSKTQTVIQQAKDAIEVLEQLLQSQQKIVYVCCSSGTLLSPLLVALYLYIYANLSIKRALEYVKQKHPISAIDERVMTIASEITQQRYFNRENFDLNGSSRNGKIKISNNQ